MCAIRFAESCRAAAREREMRPEQFGVVARWAVVVAVVMTCVVTVGKPSHGPAFGAAAVTAAQDAAAVEAALGLDRPTRRLIQQGLGNEGFDPGAPDGLFGPRTRDAIRRWQAAQGLPATGHVDSEQVELLRAAGAPRAAGPESVEPPAAPVDDPVAPPDSALKSAAAPVAAAGNTPAPVSTAGEDGSPPARATGNARQLPPEILVDRHLVRVERFVADRAYGAARDVIDEIDALQQAHDLALEDEFHFTYARLAFAAGLHETAIDAVNEYLLAAGRDGDFYRDALELLDSAEVALRRAEAERRRVEAERRRIEEERRREQARQRENYELARRQIDLAAAGLPQDELRSGGLGPEMVPIASGRFQFATLQSSWLLAEPHLAWVIIDQPLAISKYEVTRGEFERFVDSSRYRTEAEQDGRCGSRNSSWRRPRLYSERFDQTDAHPVVCVSHRDAMAYATWLSDQTGQTYRLPSPAEWQYAARAGSNAAMLHVDHVEGEQCGRANLDDTDWGDGPNCTDGVRYTAPVGRFSPNGVGVHDMIGNVAELVLGCGHDTGDYIGVSRDGSSEDIDGCEWPSTMGGAYYHDGIRAEITYYGTRDFLYRYSDEGRAGVGHVGIRLVRDLRE